MSYRKSNSNNHNSGGRRTKISFGAIVAIVLAGVLFTTATTTAIGFASKGFTNNNIESWFEKELNEDNLIKEENYCKVDSETAKGLKIKIKDDGSIFLSGCQDEEKVTGDSYYDVKFVDVTVEAGKYILSSGNDKASKDTFCLQYDYISDGEKQVGWVYDDPVPLEFTETTTITLSIAVVRGERFFGIQSYLRPVLVPDGATNTGFYK